MPVLLHKIWQVLGVLKTHLGELERKYARFQSRTASNFKLRISLLLAFSVINVVLGAVVYRWVTSEGWGDAMFTVYAVLYGIPGSDVTNAPSFGGTVVLNLIFIFGLLVFATILAMITEEVNSLLASARSGKQPLALTGHILLLNWNHQLSFILDQLEQVQAGHPFAGRPVVILAEKGKEDMDGMVVSFLKQQHLEVHTRTGKPYKLEHLQRVSAADAHAVLVLHPDCAADDDGGGDGGDDDSSVSGQGGGVASDDPGAAALKMQTIMALTAQLLGKKAAVVVQVPESAKDGSSGLQVLDQVLAMAGRPTHLLNMPVKRMVNSLAVQTTLQPWSATIYHSILHYGLQPSVTFLELPASLCRNTAGTFPASGGGESNFPASASSYGFGSYGARAAENAASTTYEAVRVHFAAELLLLGFIRKQQLTLNPHEGSRLVPGDVLVALSKHVDAAAVALTWRQIWLPVVLDKLAAISSSVQQKMPKPPSMPTFRSRWSSSSSIKAVQQANSTAAAAAGLAGTSSSSTELLQQQQQQQQQQRAHSLSKPRSLAAINEADGDEGQAAAHAAAAAGAGGPAAAAVAAAAAAAAAADVDDELQPSTPRKEDDAPPAAAAEVEGLGADNLAADSRAAASTKASIVVDATPAAPAATAAATGTAALAVAAGTAAAAAADVDDSAADVDTVGGAEQARQSAFEPETGAAPAAVSPTAAVAAAAAGATTSYTDSTVGSAGIKQKKSQTTAKSSSSSSSSFSDMLRKLCCAAPSTVDDEFAGKEDAAAGGDKQHGSSSGKGIKDVKRKGSFKGVTKLTKGVTKGVTGAVSAVTSGVTTGVSAVTTGVTTVAAGVTTGVTAVGGAVMSVAEGAADLSKTVVTGAVSTVADGAVSLGKAAAGAVTTVADGAVTLSKGAVNVVTDGAGSLAKGALGAVSTVTGAVSTAVSSTTGLVSSSSSSFRQGSGTNKGLERSSSSSSSSSEAGWAPTTWLFGAGKKLQSTAKSLASKRLAKVPPAAARGPPTRRLRIVVAGFTAQEAAEDLLPHFLDFAPPGSTVTFAVKDDEQPPEGFEWQGDMREVEEREDAEPINHHIRYKFLPSDKPTSRDTLAAAGLLAANSVLLAADESLRGNPAEADAQVLAALVEVQHLLASRKMKQQSYSAASNSSNRSAAAVGGLAVAGSAGSGSSSSGLAAVGAAGFSALGKSFKKVGSFGASAGKKTDLDGEGFEPETSGADAATAAELAGNDLVNSVNTEATTADSAAAATQQQHQLSLADRAASAARMQQQQALLSEQQEQRDTPPHVVACVATSSSKAVAAAFFGPPNGANDNAKIYNTLANDSAALAGSAAADAGAGHSSSSSSEGGVVGGLFTYELLVPGEVEGAVLVQVANEPQYVKVVTQLLATSEGCELYLLSPSSFGFSVGESLAFAEVQEVGRLLRKTALGVVAGGGVVLLPEPGWRWTVAEHDRIAAIAESW